MLRFSSEFHPLIVAFAVGLACNTCYLEFCRKVCLFYPTYLFIQSLIDVSVDAWVFILFFGYYLVLP